MEDLNGFDLEKFSGEIASILKELTVDGRPKLYLGPAIAGAMTLVLGAWYGPIGAAPGAKIGSGLHAPDRQKAVRNALETTEEKAKELIARSDIRSLLCPSLKQVSGDAFDISKAITPVLVGSVIAGNVNIPLNSLLFAVLALVIARMGIEALCRSRHETKKDEVQSAHNTAAPADQKAPLSGR